MSSLYRQLDSDTNEIRLLSILPSHEENAAPTCSIQYESLDRLPRFTALSYCWGDAKETVPITVDGHTYAATLNLYLALQILRTAPDVQRLWIDAICINQNDAAEKARQIMLMGSIFRVSQQVIAWLGPGGEDLAPVFNFASKREKLTTLPQEKQDVVLSALVALAKKDYWQRVWILQELTLARSATIICGRQQVAWQALSASLPTILPHLEIETRETFGGLNCLIALRAKQHWGLFDVMRSSLHSRATQPRDKIFGLLGLVTDARDFVAIPNYVQTIEEVNKSLILTYIASTGKMDPVVVLGQGIGNASQKLPSWLPRWHELHFEDVATRLEYLATTHDTSEGIPRHGVQEKNHKYKTAGNSIGRPYYSNNILTCHVLSIGSIVAMTASINDNSYTCVQPTHQLLENPYVSRGKQSGLHMSRTVHETSDAILLSFYTSFTGRERVPFSGSRTHSEDLMFSRGMPWPYYNYMPPYLSEFLRTWRSEDYRAMTDTKLQEWIDAHRGFMVHGRTLQEWAKRVTWSSSALFVRGHDAKYRSSTFWQTKLVDVALKRMHNNVERGRRFIISSQGYVGWAPQSAQVGDALFILQGCTVPVVLRERSEGGCYMIGEAYVQGLMYGQGVRDLGDDDWSEVELH